MNTKFSYMYRDASNYKESNAVIFKGTLTAEEKAELYILLGEGDGFIPHQVGLEDLQPRMISFPSEDDHVWHEADPIETETEEVPTEGRTVQEFLAAARSVQWDVVDACELLGIVG